MLNAKLNIYINAKEAKIYINLTMFSLGGPYIGHTIHVHSPLFDTKNTGIEYV